jgi:DNA-binding protein H-NS
MPVRDNLNSMGVDALLELRDQLNQLLSERGKQAERQLRAIEDRLSATRPEPVSIPVKFRSRQNPELTWSGRGAIPRWMREEIRGTRLTKEDFRIAP